MGDYEFLPHTGDIGIRVRADTLEDLYATAARAMFEILAEPPPSTPLQDEIAVREERPDLLMKAWLDELLYRFLVDRRLYGAWEVTAVDARSLRARVRGSILEPGALRTELKAVTLHGLEVKKEEDRWLATVIFDV